MYAKYTVSDVLNLELDNLNKLTNTSWHLRTLHALRKCRTKALGGHLDWCSHCHKLHLQFNSCRNRHCSICQGHKQHQWIQARRKELLNVPYFHVVFTIPHHLNPIALSHPKKVYKILFDSVWQTLSTFGNNPKHLGAKMGMIAILHTWGQNLSLHPHLHCIVPKGGVSKAGYWKNGTGKNDFLFSVKALSKKFRGVFIAKLRKQLPEIKQDVYDRLFDKKWVVYAKSPFGNPENIIEYLGRYTHKIAISNSRILAIDKQKKEVTFSLKEYRNGGRKTTLTLSFKDFIRRFQNHILPKGFTRIRHYGFLSSSWKREKLPQIQLQLLDRDKEVLGVYIDSEKSLLNVCPSCKKGTLITLLTFDGRGPPENYRQIVMRKISKYI
ncbi:IS91 family transposase [Tenacibaculum finnmarkense]|uniref:Transposase n=14 Tax=Tenacibaculum finnmarkense TaxID=2781243 RepID=A0A2I2M9G4_9FLAO|nr:IS91 family transposase [Tenacibaculum finnmarkense]MBE7646621.1 IS91 family transposase [Tenacibaculum finnmarkense genomovar ulcerans]MBE7698573.1 IS91 family transposase [Tenacibaculum finnmarkense genomovar ulcerans]MCG8763332.1 IS91 family transposase [Tenacibaculum finnmarkense]MCG8788709.1 IS91 family transposase [Tenacibaculum finnmarkense]MCG8796445.1 IS91 family transposase [Tenacibaculum finnmarkense]